MCIPLIDNVDTIIFENIYSLAIITFIIRYGYEFERIEENSIGTTWFKLLVYALIVSVIQRSTQDLFTQWLAILTLNVLDLQYSAHLHAIVAHFQRRNSDLKNC